MRSIKGVTGIVILAGAALWAQSGTSVWDGVYSEAQAKSGAGLYAQQCASCHGEKLEGRGQAPPLAGAEFTMGWSGMTLGDLFEKIQSSMPGDRPGSLMPEQNAAILAYMLSANKFPAGSASLPGDADKLRPIRFEAAKTK